MIVREMDKKQNAGYILRQGKKEGRRRVDPRIHGQQQLFQLPEERAAFWRASSSSAWADHVGVLTDDRKTLSRFFNSFSRSMLSFLEMMTEMSESKRF